MTNEAKSHQEVIHSYLDILSREIDQALNSNTVVAWHHASSVPEDCCRCIVRTKEGATFMFEPISGRWPDWVEKWMYIPD